ncbi:hypothetical protein BC567DRAFT_93431 [Phyllosticta citribraziliensis]
MIFKSALLRCRRASTELVLHNHPWHCPRGMRYQGFLNTTSKTPSSSTSTSTTPAYSSSFFPLASLHARITDIVKPVCVAFCTVVFWSFWFRFYSCQCSFSGRGALPYALTYTTYLSPFWPVTSYFPSPWFVVSSSMHFPQRAKIKRFFRGLGGFRRAGFFARMDAPHQQGFLLFLSVIEGKVCRSFFLSSPFSFLSPVVLFYPDQELSGWLATMDTLTLCFGGILFF